MCCLQINMFSIDNQTALIVFALAKYSLHLCRSRSGRSGGQWRHIKQATGQTGSNLLFIEGESHIFRKGGGYRFRFLDNQALYKHMHLYRSSCVSHSLFFFNSCIRKYNCKSKSKSCTTLIQLIIFDYTGFLIEG